MSDEDVFNYDWVEAISPKKLKRTKLSSSENSSNS